jgi:hypothetical protein
VEKVLRAGDAVDVPSATHAPGKDNWMSAQNSAGYFNKVQLSVEPTVELVMSEFGAQRQNRGGATFPGIDRLQPTLEGFWQQFPGARVTLYTDFPCSTDGVDTVLVDPPFDRAHERYGWRAHDYYQAYGLLQSEADVAIAMDSDMLIVSERFRTIVVLAERFGLALPANSRLQILREASWGEDSSYDLDLDPTEGTGFAYNLSPLAFATRHSPSRRLLELYCQFMRSRPGRASLHLWEAVYFSGVNPYLLPFQWCICTPRDVDSRHIWGEEIVLHLGHPNVYPRFLKERRGGAPRRALQRLKAIRPRW